VRPGVGANTNEELVTAAPEQIAEIEAKASGTGPVGCCRQLQSSGCGETRSPLFHAIDGAG
jgi:hypothetical protein